MVRSFAYIFSIFIFVLFTLLPHFSISQTCDPYYDIDPNPVSVFVGNGDKTITFVAVIQEEDQGGGNCTSTWLYCIDNGTTGTNISHVVFGLCDGVCFYDSTGAEIGRIVDAGYWTGSPSNPDLTTWPEAIQPGTDPTTDFCGVKLDETADANGVGYDFDSDGIIGFYFTIPGYFEVGTTFEIALKAGTEEAIATVPGPEFAEDENDCELCTTLPIELFRFDGKTENDRQNHLFWTTLSESNSDRFEIERQSEETGWIPIGMLMANGNPYEQTNYSFVDHAPTSGHNYYRLKLVDIDGSYNYSQIIVLENKTQSKQEFIIYPTPVYESFNLMYSANSIGIVDIQIVNQLGQLVHVIKDQVLAKGTNRMTIDIQNLTPGWYALQMKGEGVSEVKAFVKN